MAGNAAKLCSELGIRQIRLLPYHTMGAGKYEDLGREYLMEDGLTADLTLLERMVEEIKDRGIECWIE